MYPQIKIFCMIDLKYKKDKGIQFEQKYCYSIKRYLLKPYI